MDLRKPSFIYGHATKSNASWQVQRSLTRRRHANRHPLISVNCHVATSVSEVHPGLERFTSGPAHAHNCNKKPRLQCGGGEKTHIYTYIHLWSVSARVFLLFCFWGHPKGLIWRFCKGFRATGTYHGHDLRGKTYTSHLFFGGGFECGGRHFSWRPAGSTWFFFLFFFFFFRILWRSAGQTHIGDTRRAHKNETNPNHNGTAHANEGKSKDATPHTHTHKKNGQKTVTNINARENAVRAPFARYA